MIQIDYESNVPITFFSIALVDSSGLPAPVASAIGGEAAAAGFQMITTSSTVGRGVSFVLGFGCGKWVYVEREGGLLTHMESRK